MSKEIAELNELMTGMKPASFGDFGNGATNRQNKLGYTWNDLDANLNSAPFEADTAIIVTSYHGQLAWLKSTLTSYRKSGHYVILAYDNPAYIWSNIDSPEFQMHFLPHPRHYLLAHSVVVKHKTYDADKRTGWFWDVWYAQGIIRNLPNIKYVYCTNGDCLVEKPEGFQELKKILGDGDLMSGQSEPKKTIHTADMIMKVDAFHKIMDYMSQRMRFAIIGSQSPEALLRDAVDMLGLKETFAEQPTFPEGHPHAGAVDYYCTGNLESTWKKVLGFRNLYAEFEWHENNGLEPKGFEDYFDRWNDWFYVKHMREGWYNTICKYWDTKDRRYLLKFWDEGKDSAEDRKFEPLEYYGKEPILA